jgi:ElaB/YqjD/DUF883 family membrane-anchored ribosome-binding protein
MMRQQPTGECSSGEDGISRTVTRSSDFGTKDVALSWQSMNSPLILGASSMNTSHKPYSPESSSSKPHQSSETLGDTARNAMDSVKNTVGDAVDRGQAAVSQAGAAANEMAESATQQVKTFASELEAMAKRNPLGTVAGAVMVGVLIGFMARGRS